MFLQRYGISPLLTIAQTKFEVNASIFLEIGASLQSEYKKENTSISNISFLQETDHQIERVVKDIGQNNIRENSITCLLTYSNSFINCCKQNYEIQKMVLIRSSSYFLFQLLLPIVMKNSYFYQQSNFIIQSTHQISMTLQERKQIQMLLHNNMHEPVKSCYYLQDARDKKPIHNRQKCCVFKKTASFSLLTNCIQQLLTQINGRILDVPSTLTKQIVHIIQLFMYVNRYILIYQMWIRKAVNASFKFSKTHSKIKTPSIKEIREHWDSVSEGYNKIDYCPQTMYYSLLYMLEPWKAKNILQVACGTGKMLPIAINLKDQKTNYLATDLSPEMIALTKANLQKNLDLYDSQLSLKKWLKKNNVYIKVANAEKSLKKPQDINQKFDRIICNCVLMLTQNSQKMLKNLSNEAEKGCLLGISIWGQKNQNYVMTLAKQAMMQAGIPLSKKRQNFYLYKKIPKLASPYGWKNILTWEQNALFPAVSTINPKRYRNFLQQLIDAPDGQSRTIATQILMKKMQRYFPNGGVNFSCEMMIMKKA